MFSTFPILWNCIAAFSVKEKESHRPKLIETKPQIEFIILDPVGPM